MLGYLKINTAAVICSAFILRLLFVNIGIISSLNTLQYKTSSKKQFLAVSKKRKGTEVLDNAKNCEYTTLEICEEGPDDENQFKLSAFTLVKAFYALSIDKTGYDLKQIAPFYQHSSYVISHRYLAFQVFRI